MEISDPHRFAGIRGADSPLAHWFIGQLFRVPRLAHHPTCRCFDKHLIRLGSFNLCLGCTCLTLGAIAGFTFFAWIGCTHWPEVRQVSAWTLIGVGVGLYAPALIQPFVQYKPFKVVSRVLLGLSVPCLCFGALVGLPLDAWGWILRGLFMVIFWYTYRATQWFRARWTPAPCEGCPGGVFPFCLDNRHRVIALFDELQARAGPDEQEFVDLAAALAGLNRDVSIEFVTPRMILTDKRPSS